MPSEPALRDPEFRLRPRRPRVVRDESKAWSRSFKALIHLVRMTSRAAHPRRDQFGLGSGLTKRNYQQRCAVRVTYSANRVRGQWAAHGRYLARHSATQLGESKAVGFSTDSEAVDIATTLSSWQTAGDRRLFKVIVSPEFGERLDLRHHTRELLARMERDLGVRLEWVAVAHFNTDHPHVHIALRGQTDTGPLRLSRDYIKHGIRNHAEALCTAQLGFRTELDALAAERREVHAQHITSLDRMIARRAFGPGGDGVYSITAQSPAGSANQKAHRLYVSGRLRVLATMGLALEIDPSRYQVDPGFFRNCEPFRSVEIARKRKLETGSGVSESVAQRRQ